MSRKRRTENLQAWEEARKRHRLSHAHVQMARALGMNPKKLGKLDNHRQEPWKLPLPRFIEELYRERFGKRRPGIVENSTLSEELNERASGKAKELRRRELVTLHDAHAPGAPLMRSDG